MNLVIGFVVLYVLYQIVSSLFTKIREGFNAPGGAPCDKPEDCESQKCEEKEGIKMCADVPVQMSPGA